MSPETRFVESPRFWQGASVIVVELLGGLGGEVVEVLVRAFGVEREDPFGGAQLDVVDIAQGPCRRISSFLNDPTVVSARALSKASPTDPTEGSTPSATNAGSGPPRCIDRPRRCTKSSR